MTVLATDRRHIKALTGLRWFAALAVFFHHSAAPEWLPDPIRHVMGAGSNGVTFFFVLSGFVIALNYFDKFSAPTARDTWNYFAGRFARIYPLYILVLILVWATLGGHGNLYRLGWQIFAVQAWHPQLWVAYGNNAPGWSIGVEFFLYACFPLLVLLLRPLAARPKILLALAAVVVLLVFAAAIFFELRGPGLRPTNPNSAHRWLYRMPAAHLGDFVLGMIAALLLRDAHRRWTPSTVRDRVLAPLLTWFPVVVTLLLMAWPGRWHYYASLDAFWILPAAMLCLGLSLYPGASLSRLFSLRAVVLLGEASFAFYLVHRPIMQAFRAETFGASGSVGYVVRMLLLVLFITAVAIVCHFLLERPAQRLFNRLLRRKARPQTPTSEVASASSAPEDAEQPAVRV